MHAQAARNEPAISGGMRISEAVQKYPQFAEIAAKYGLHCFGCYFSPMETIEQGSLGHGMPKEVYEMMLKELNEKLAGVEPVKQDWDGVALTPAARSKLEEVMKRQGKDSGYGLRVDVMPGDHGFEYDLSFEKNDSAGKDRTIDAGGIRIIVKPESYEMLKGATIDFVETPAQAGLKISNPHALAGCGCGVTHLSG